MDASDWNTLLLIAEQPHMEAEILAALQGKLSREARDIAQELLVKREDGGLSNGNGSVGNNSDQDRFSRDDESAAVSGARAILRWAQQNAQVRV